MGLCTPFSGNLNIEEHQPLERLVQGNRRFVEGTILQCDKSAERRQALTQVQSPFAVVLGCSDSRVSPEIIFDQGIGSLFVVRVAGNVVDPLVLDSVNFAVSQLGASLIVVLGHENCGAFRAMLDHQESQIPALAPLLQPAVTLSSKLSGNHLENAIKTNVKLIVDSIKQYPSFVSPIQDNRLKVVGGYYRLASGEVELF